MNENNKPLTVAAVQTVSGTDPAANTAAVCRLVRQAAEAGADWVVLPEYWPLMGAHDTDKLAVAEPFGCGPLQTALSQAARENNIFLFGGSIPLTGDTPDKVSNTLTVFAPDGLCICRYDKMHLFGFSGLGERYAEADTIQPGRNLPPSLEINDIRIAQGICYDLRFPEFFRAQAPFDILLLPAAFTQTTGRAHWELLLRARAVENQCYVVAAAQGGLHQNGRRTFGHSMIVDPWGEICAVLPEGEGVITATIDTGKMAAIRNRLPALRHRIL